MNSPFLVTGLMSGTSLDGIDMALCRFSQTPSGWHYSFIDAVTTAYPESLRRKLTRALTLSDKALRELDMTLGAFYGRELNDFHSKNRVTPDLISSHGHTVFHDPSGRMTLQIGNGNVISGLTGITVVNNFRVKDVEHGGQGAPLVPAGDRLLFGEYDICLNIGGIANLSYEEKGLRRGFDICPANMVLNYLSEKRGKKYDRDGAMAASGKCIQKLLEELNRLEYYRMSPPKSLGREWFERMFIPVLQHSRYPVEDLMTTCAEHIAHQISRVLVMFGRPSVLITGGGAWNRYLMDRIRNLSGLELPLPDNTLIGYKESLVFGLLGLLRLRNEINCYASVTGASRDLSTGNIHTPE
ncbi:MAG: anhydro-N-acetylmuramic acid kinase [Bacteroidales bacterium]|nr:anhydro-N-acetylmuramic acid kinase [Bacteroidales bacterium]MBN2697399.1 anhydro-N-acetylmuramic acid kinase [Bacteroidales bacterium]